MLEPKERHIYEVHSRNLLVGVFDPDVATIERGGVTLYGFIGIRTKFTSRYLFTEHGHALRELGRIEDDRIQLWERYPGTMCEFCGEAVSRIHGQWTHVQPGSHEPGPMSRPTYYPLFHLLEDFESELD